MAASFSSCCGSISKVVVRPSCLLSYLIVLKSHVIRCTLFLYVVVEICIASPSFCAPKDDMRWY